MILEANRREVVLVNTRASPCCENQFELSSILHPTQNICNFRQRHAQRTDWLDSRLVTELTRISI